MIHSDLTYGEFPQMKVAYLITKAELGGAQSHVLELIDGMRSAHEITLATGTEGWLAERARASGVAVRVLPDLVNPISLVRDAKALTKVMTWLRDEKPSLLHAHSSKAGLLGRAAARWIGIPSVFTAHGWAFTDGASWRRKMVAVPSEWAASRLGGDIICVSNFDYALASKFRIKRRACAHTVWNGIGDVPSRAHHMSAVPRICMVARFAPPKDQCLVLDALAGIDDLAWELHFVGDGPQLAETKAIAKRKGIDARVRFLGSRDDVAEVLCESEIFVLASQFEGLPISILEAMRAGLPVIASNVGGVSEAVLESDTGLLVPKGDVGAMRAALRRLLLDRDLRVRLGAAGRARYEVEFEAKAMIEKTRRVYSECLRRHGVAQ